MVPFSTRRLVSQIKDGTVLRQTKIELGCIHSVIYDGAFYFDEAESSRALERILWNETGKDLEPKDALSFAAEILFIRVSERYQKSLTRSAFRAQQLRPRSQELRNRSCSMKFLVTTSSKPWRRVACVRG